MKIINMRIAKSPINWLKVNLMALLGLLAIYYISSLFFEPVELEE